MCRCAGPGCRYLVVGVLGAGMFSFDVPQKLSRLIGRLARSDLLDKLTGLTLTPEYSANVARIETLIHLALAGVGGKKVATKTDLVALLNGFEGHNAHLCEDPAEDVFVASVALASGNFRVFLGNYTGADYSLQRLLDAVFAKEFQHGECLSRQCEALLRLSDLVAARRDLAVNTVAQSEPRREDWPFLLPDILRAGQASCFTMDDLKAAGIDPTDLAPFILPNVTGLLNQDFEATSLIRHPLVKDSDALRLPVPSYVQTSLRLYLAQAINLGLVPQEATERFHRAQFTRWLGVDLPLRKAKPLELAPLNLPEPNLPGVGLTQAILRFDADKILHLFILECDWRDPPETNIRARKAAPPKLQKGLIDYIKAVQTALSTNPGADRGFTLIVYDSPGWSLTAHIPEALKDNWYVTAMPAKTLSILLDDPAFSIIEMWKLLHEVQILDGLGVKLAAWPDNLNYWSIWKAFGSTFWPPRIDLRKFGAIAPDTSKIIDTMEGIRSSTNRHAAPLVTGDWQMVERWVEELSPSQDYTKPIYLSPIDMALGTLRAAVEVTPATWWVSTARPPFDPEDRQLMLLVWQAACEWLLRIAKTASGRIDLGSEPIEVRLLLTPKQILDAPDEIQFVPFEELIGTTIVYPPSLPDWLMTVDNSGEKILVRSLIDAVSSITQASLRDDARAAWTEELTADPILKMIHVTPHGDHGYAADLVSERLGFRFLQDNDMAAVRRLVRDELPISSEGRVAPTSGTITGRDYVSKTLNAVVDLHWQRCRTLIRELDRASTLVLLTRLIEALHRERVSTERSGPARNSAFADSPEYAVMAQINMAHRDQAFQTYRVLAEMVLCEAPLTGGRIAGITDIDRLAAEVAILIQTAHDSDALYRNMIVASALFHDDGSLEMAHGGAGALIQDFQRKNFAESLALDVDNYPSLFEQMPDEAAEDFLKEGDLFLKAFQAEFGLDLRRAFDVSDALQAMAVQRNSDFACIPLDELKVILGKGGKPIDGATLDLFLNAFALAPRLTWDGKPPKPYTLNDVFPWFFERRLSLMLRPVMTFKDTNSRIMILFGVRQIGMGVQYASYLLEKGDWPPERLVSAEARAWIDLEGNRRGTAFEDEIHDTFQKAGWQAFKAVAMARFGASKELGDVDVLAVSPDGAQWRVVECKWFGAARTPREIDNWLQGFRGEKGDKLGRHLKRCAWVESNTATVAKVLKLKSQPQMIEPRIVTTIPVPIAILEGLPKGSEVMTRRQLTADLQAGR